MHRGGGKLGWDLSVVGESDGVSGRSNQPNKVSVVISEFGAAHQKFLDPPL